MSIQIFTASVLPTRPSHISSQFKSLQFSPTLSARLLKHLKDYLQRRKIKKSFHVIQYLEIIWQAGLYIRLMGLNMCQALIWSSSINYNRSDPASPPSSGCLASGGPAAGSPCIFPFIYDGVRYEGCAPLYGWASVTFFKFEDSGIKHISDYKSPIKRRITARILNPPIWAVRSFG